MPRLAFAANLWTAEVCSTATTAALTAGFKFIWSSVLVHEFCQIAQRAAIDAHPTVTRGELFLAGTVNTRTCDTYTNCRESTLAGSYEQMARLGPEVLDMLMLDYPPGSGGCEAILGQWAAFTELYKEGKVRSIAVSNFHQSHLDCLLAPGVMVNGTAVIVPAVNQLRYSVVDQYRSAEFASNFEHGIYMQAYSPLAAGGVVSDAVAGPILEAIGNARVPPRTAAQVGLRFLLQKNVTIATQSTDPVHLAQNADLFGWNLTAAEMAQLDSLDD